METIKKNIFIYLNPSYADKMYIFDLEFIFCRKMPYLNNFIVNNGWSYIPDWRFRQFMTHFLTENEKPVHKAINMRGILTQKGITDVKKYPFNVFKETHIKAYHLKTPLWK